MTRYWGLAAFGLLAALAPLSQAATAQDVIKLGDYQDWTAYSAGAGADKVCYVVGEPAPKPPDRMAFVYVTNRPGKKAMGVLMAYSGYAYKPESDATVEIGKGKFALFTYRDTAWAADAETDEKVVKAMRAGKTMSIKSTPSSGPATTDTYSLNGLIAALRRIGEACPTR